jgi:hypothetical protein
LTLASKRPDSAVIHKALKAIEDLNRKQFCHRFAASMLLDNCKSTSELQSSTPSYDVAEEERRESYLRMFAISLTLCDIEALQRPLPRHCERFGQNALMSVKKNGGGLDSLQVRDADINRCLKEIGADQSTVVSWKFNQQSAAVVCQVARMDIEKDETIALFGYLTRLMSEVVDEITKLSELNRGLVHAAEEAQESVHGLWNSIRQLKNGVTNIWTDIAAETGKAQHALKEAFGGVTTYAADMESLLQRLRRTAMESHAENAAVQQQAYDLATDVTNQVQRANGDVVALRDVVLTLYENMNVMGMGLAAMNERQQKADEQSQKVLQVLVNVTEQLSKAAHLGEDHTVVLAKATKIAEGLADIVEKTSGAASNWQNSMLRSGSGPIGASWPLFLGMPTMVLLLGSYGLPASLIRNTGLLVTGKFCWEFRRWCYTY